MKQLLPLIFFFTFINNSFSQTQPTCPGTGYCMQGLHGEFAAAFQTIAYVKFAGIDNQQPVGSDAVPPTDAHCAVGAATVKGGQTYKIELAGDANSGTDNNLWGVWIDYNKDGSFDEIECVFINNEGKYGITSGDIYINALLAQDGKTRMRVRSQWPSDGPVTSDQACTEFFYGETEDYEINIQACFAEGEITASGETFFCIGDSVLLTASEGTKYEWNTGDTTQSIWAKDSITYSCFITNTNGCVAYVEQEVRVIECPPTGISTHLFNEYFSIQNHSNEFIIATKNSSTTIKSIQVMNLLGQPIQGAITPNNAHFTQLSPGAYLINIETNKGLFKQKTLIY